MNTYGAFAMQASFFFNRSEDPYLISIGRDILNICARVHNIAFNILGYIPIIRFFSGICRISTGLIIRVISPTFKRTKYYEEMVQMSYAQTVRGSFEALFPCGRSINLILDIVATFFNLQLLYTKKSTPFPPIIKNGMLPFALNILYLA